MSFTTTYKSFSSVRVQSTLPADLVSAISFGSQGLPGTVFVPGLAAAYEAEGCVFTPAPAPVAFTEADFPALGRPKTPSPATWTKKVVTPAPAKPLGGSQKTSPEDASSTKATAPSASAARYEAQSINGYTQLLTLTFPGWDEEAAEARRASYKLAKALEARFAPPPPPPAARSKECRRALFEALAASKARTEARDRALVTAWTWAAFTSPRTAGALHSLKEAERASKKPLPPAEVKAAPTGVTTSVRQPSWRSRVHKPKNAPRRKPAAPVWPIPDWGSTPSDYTPTRRESRTTVLSGVDHSFIKIDTFVPHMWHLQPAQQQGISNAALYKFRGALHHRRSRPYGFSASSWRLLQLRSLFVAPGRPYLTRRVFRFRRFDIGSATRAPKDKPEEIGNTAPASGPANHHDRHSPNQLLGMGPRRRVGCSDKGNCLFRALRSQGYVGADHGPFLVDYNLSDAELSSYAFTIFISTDVLYNHVEVGRIPSQSVSGVYLVKCLPTTPFFATPVGKGARIVADDDLCGVKQVPGQLLTTLAPGYELRPAFDILNGTFPKEVTQTRPLYHFWNTAAASVGGGLVSLEPETAIETHYPTDLRRLREVKTISPENQYILGSPKRLTPVVAKVADIPPLPRPSYPFKSQYAEGSDLLSNHVDPNIQKALDLMLQSERVYGGRIPRGTGATDSARVERLIASVQHFQEAATGQRYLRAAYKLCSRLIQSVALRDSKDDRFQELYQPTPAGPVNMHNVIYLAAKFHPILGNDNGNNVAAPDPNDPESYLDEPGVRDAIRDGTYALLDVSGMRREQVREYVNAFWLQSQENKWAVAIRNSNNDDVRPMVSPLGVETIQGARRLYIHWGSTPASQIVPLHQLCGNPAPGEPNYNFRNTPLNTSVIAGTLESLIIRHHAGSDVAVALELAMYRSNFFLTLDMPAGMKRAGRGSESFLCTGGRELRLPVDYTGMQYFDFMFLESPVPDYVRAWLQTTLQPNVMKWNMYYACMHMAQSINWPSVTFSLKGELIHALHERANGRLPANVSPYIASHIDRFDANFYIKRDDVLTMWQVAHKNACAHRFGYSPSTTFFELSAPYPLDLWADNRPVYITHPYYNLWMASSIPYHAVLPTTKSVPLWSKEEFTPDEGMYTQLLDARFGGFLETHEQAKYLSDDGSDFSFAHFLGTPNYVAQVGHQTRAEHAQWQPQVQGVVWNKPRDYETPSPVNPASTVISFSYNGPAGNGNPLSNFAVPGAFTNIDWVNWRARAGGMFATNAVHNNAPLAQQLSNAWKRFYQENPEPLMSLGLKVRPPVWSASFVMQPAEYLMYPLFEKATDPFGGYALFDNADGSQISAIRSMNIAMLAPGPMANVLPSVLQNHNPNSQRRPYQLKGPEVFDAVKPFVSEQRNSHKTYRAPKITDLPPPAMSKPSFSSMEVSLDEPDVRHRALPGAAEPRDFNRRAPSPLPSRPTLQYDDSKNPYDASMVPDVRETTANLIGSSQEPAVRLDPPSSNTKPYAWTAPPDMQKPTRPTVKRSSITPDENGVINLTQPLKGAEWARMGLVDDEYRLKFPVIISNKNGYGQYNVGDIPSKAPFFGDAYVNAPKPKARQPKAFKTEPYREFDTVSAVDLGESKPKKVDKANVRFELPEAKPNRAPNPPEPYMSFEEWSTTNTQPQPGSSFTEADWPKVKLPNPGLPVPDPQSVQVIGGAENGLESKPINDAAAYATQEAYDQMRAKFFGAGPPGFPDSGFTPSQAKNSSGA